MPNIQRYMRMFMYYSVIAIYKHTYYATSENTENSTPAAVITEPFSAWVVKSHSRKRATLNHYHMKPGNYNCTADREKGQE